MKIRKKNNCIRDIVLKFQQIPVYIPRIISRSNVILDPNPLVRCTDPDFGTFHHQAKIEKPRFLLFCYFFMTIYLAKMV
jgi:hypothetical protein